MMEPALPEFSALLSEIELHPPEIPVISNTSGRPLSPEQAVDPAYWADHIRRPVRFSDGLQYLSRTYDYPVFLELGPGHTLSDLVRQQATEAQAFAAFEDKSPTDESREPLLTLGRIWCAGVDIDWQRFYADEPQRKLRLPTYPFQRLRYWMAESICRCPQAALRNRLARGVAQGSRNHDG